MKRAHDPTAMTNLEGAGRKVSGGGKFERRVLWPLRRLLKRKRLFGE